MISSGEDAFHEADVTAVRCGQDAQMVAFTSLARGDRVAGLEGVVLCVEGKNRHPDAAQLAGEARVAVVVCPVLISE